jgi:hypothetical protein
VDVEAAGVRKGFSEAWTERQPATGKYAADEDVDGGCVGQRPHGARDTLFGH